MFSDTLSIGWAGGTGTFTKVNQDKYSSEYRYADGGAGIKANLFIRHSSYTNKSDGIVYDRHNVEFTFVTKVTDAPNLRRKIYFVVEVPSDDDPTSIQWLFDLIDSFGGISGALAKLANGES